MYYNFSVKVPIICLEAKFYPVSFFFGYSVFLPHGYVFHIKFLYDPSKTGGWLRDSWKHTTATQTYDVIFQSFPMDVLGEVCELFSFLYFLQLWGNQSFKEQQHIFLYLQSL